jgi:hypothetical protein
MRRRVIELDRNMDRLLTEGGQDLRSLSIPEALPVMDTRLVNMKKTRDLYADAVGAADGNLSMSDVRGQGWWIKEKLRGQRGEVGLDLSRHDRLVRTLGKTLNHLSVVQILV